MSDGDRMEPGEIDLATLREGFAALACEPPVTTAGPCPEAETIYRAVAGELPPRELRAVVEHSAACPQCAEAWRLAKAFEEEAAVEVAEPHARPAASRPPLRLVSLAAALLVALVAAGVWLTVDPLPEEAPVVRGAGDGTEVVSVLSDGGPLDRAEPELRWRVGVSGAPEGTSYDLLVTTEDGDLVAEVSDLDAPVYALPGDAVEALPPGTRLLWSVTATTPGGRRLESATFVNTLR